jgi:hypothetical protein
VVNEKGKFAFSLASQRQAASICYDRNDSSISLPTLKELNILKKVLGKSPEGATFFHERFIGMKGKFWLADEVSDWTSEKGVAFDHQGATALEEQAAGLGVICVKR